MKELWLSNYPAGIAHEIDVDDHSTLIDLCCSAWHRYPRERAFGNFSSYLSFADVERLSAAFASYLQHQVGLMPGDKVALMMPNALQYPVAMLGVLRAGGIVVNTNPQYTARELRHQLSDSEAKCIVVFKGMLRTVHEVVAQTTLRSIVTTEIGDLFSFPKSTLFNRIAQRKYGKFGGQFSIPVTSFTRALKLGADDAFVPPVIRPNDLAFLQYTGGTTGISKGAMLSHGNMVANILQVSAWFGDSIDEGEEIVITALPLYHIYALTVNCFVFFYHGGLNYLITDPRDTSRLLKEIRRIPFTGIGGVNTLFKSLLEHKDFKKLNFSRLKYSSGGGAAIQSVVAESWKKATNKAITEGYGLTEASPVVCSNPFDVAEFTGCIGFPLPSTECKIVTDNGCSAGIGEPGELLVRGPQIMQGYWRQPEETAAVLDSDGWLRTGDIALMRDDGYFKIVDRKKDLILVSGFNVYPNEIEDVVVSHRGVVDVAAIGVFDAKTTETVKIVVVRRDPNLNSEDLIEYCRARLTAYKMPRHVEFVDDLPKSNIGKILRREVKEKYGAPDEQCGDRTAKVG
ncbi:MAG: long-chain acyl-CoA synthetase [Gammaproteobacteria bacterium]|jgi:long-chain acyl-CoA synthetase